MTLDSRMKEKNENIHQFIIKEAHARNGVKQSFSTTASAFEDIFGPNSKLQSF
jgi:hypothetical protein